MPVFIKSKKAPIFDYPQLIGAGGLYHYSDELLEACARIDKYGEEYSMARVIGAGEHRRIQVPRNMVGALSPSTKDIRSHGVKVNFQSSFKARDERQEKFVQGMVNMFSQGHSFIAEAPTGFGKTVCTVEAIARFGRKTLIVVTKEDLRDQWIKAAKNLLGLEYGKGVGLIQGDTVIVANQKLVIAMIHSLAKEDRYSPAIFKDFGLAGWDEVHRVGADYFAQSAFRVPTFVRFGVSATPDRKDGRSNVLEAHLGKVLIREEAMKLVPRVIARQSPWVIPNTVIYDKKTGAKKIGPIPHSPGACGHVINLIANHHGRNAAIANFVSAAYKKGRWILVQSDRKEHLEVLATMIASAGVPPAEIGFYFGGMKEADLNLSKKKHVVLATFQMTAEGTDVPHWDTLVPATPKSDLKQIAGRILREFPGKPEPIIFDLIDMTSNVFKGYWNARREFYESIGAEVSFN